MPFKDVNQMALFNPNSHFAMNFEDPNTVFAPAYAFTNEFYQPWPPQDYFMPFEQPPVNAMHQLPPSQDEIKRQQEIAEAEKEASENMRRWHRIEHTKEKIAETEERDKQRRRERNKKGSTKGARRAKKLEFRAANQMATSPSTSSSTHDGLIGGQVDDPMHIHDDPIPTPFNTFTPSFPPGQSYQVQVDAVNQANDVASQAEIGLSLDYGLSLLDVLSEDIKRLEAENAAREAASAATSQEEADTCGEYRVNYSFAKDADLFDPFA